MNRHSSHYAMKRFSVFRLELLLVCLFLSTCTQRDVLIWAVHDGVKIRPDRSYAYLRRRNAIWDGGKIHLYAAKNEVIAFQLVIEGRRTIDRVSASLKELSHTSSSEKITYVRPKADPTWYVESPIQVFPINYMEVKKTSQAPWIYTSAVPKDPIGLFPVQLVPENASKGGFPITIEKGRNQVVWFDLYISDNKPPGIYIGKIEVKYGDSREFIPVELTVFDFSLPHENSLDTMVYFEGSQVELYHGNNLDDRYHRFAHRHRVELTNAYPRVELEEKRDLFSGSAFSREAGYEGPGVDRGIRIVPASLYGVGDEYREEKSAWRASDDWLNTLAKFAPSALTFLYLADEPSPGELAPIEELALRIKANPGPGKALPLLITPGYMEELKDVVDIWLTHPELYNPDQVSTLKLNAWLYNGKRPYTGALLIETPATDPRSIAWACFKHSIPAYLYWHAVHWEHNFQKVGERKQNVWKESITFDNRGQKGKPLDWQGFANGDGVLIYPGEDKLHPEEDRGISGPIGTIQLANLRRGVQDHLYLTVAKKLGLDKEVQEALDVIVPKVFMKPLWGVGFSEDGNQYEERRRLLGLAIEEAWRKVHLLNLNSQGDR